MEIDTRQIGEYLHRVARGQNGAEHLNRQEAAWVLSALFSPDTDPLQLGAFLIAERMKGETSAELAGFVDAARGCIEGFGEHSAAAGAVDLPCYAGKRRATSMHLAAALQARDAGIPVLVHGVEHIEGRISAWQALQRAGVRRTASLAEAAGLLADEGIAYIDLAELCPPLFVLFGLRPRLGVRSFANSVARLLNPLGCDGQINGVFHTPYVELMAEANILLGQPRSLVFMGAEGEPELYAERQKLIVAQQGDALHGLNYPEAKHAVYPKQPQDQPEELLVRFAHLVEGRMDAREHAVMLRMREAFAFASSGVLAADWQVSRENDMQEA
jgi:anthranilate phosphoribosyltransferase